MSPHADPLMLGSTVMPDRRLIVTQGDKTQEEMQAEIDELRERLARLEQQHGGAEQGEQEPTEPVEAPLDRSLSRRRLFGMAGAAAAAGVTGAVLSASKAGALDGDPILIGSPANAGTRRRDCRRRTSAAPP